jgi:uncharacterized protein (TIGR02118 family)
MGVKVTVLYKQPADQAAFESHYLGTHVPLVNEMPGLGQFEYGRTLPNADGSNPDTFWVATLSFASIEDMGAAMASPEGGATVADLANFAGAGVDMLVSEIP